MLTNAPKGTKDMMPDQAYKWHYIEEAFAEICRTYGFEEIRTGLSAAAILKPYSEFWKTHPSDAPTGTGKSTLCPACFSVRTAAQKCTFV